MGMVKDRARAWLLGTAKAPTQWFVLRLFDNRLGLRRNLRYMRYLADCRRASSLSHASEDGLSVEARRALTELRRDGLCRMPPELEAKRIQTLASKVDCLLTDVRNHQPLGGELSAFTTHLHDCHRLFPEMVEFLTPNVVSVLKAYYRAHFKLYYAEVYRTHPTDKRPLLSWLWHTDDHPAPILKVMVYLTPTTDGSGAFRAFRRPSSQHLLRQGFQRDRAHLFAAELEDVTNIVVCEGPPGTTVIFDNNLVHKATVPRVGHRDVLVFEVLPGSQPYQEHLARMGNNLSADHRSDYPEDPYLD
jgi:hypothetical protein